MMAEYLAAMHGALALAGVVSIICRLKMMSKKTRSSVRWQHIALLAGLVWSVFVPKQYAALPVLAGVVVFLLLSADRWRRGAPDGTTKPAPLDDSQLRHVAGGTNADRR